MLFTAEAGIDRSQQVITNIYSSKRIQEMGITRIFVDFKVDNLMQCVLPNKQIFGYNPLEETNGTWDNIDELILNYKNFKQQDFQINNQAIPMGGLCAEYYDEVTRSFFVKSNALGMLQTNDESIMLANFVAYMLTYRMLKMSGDKPGEPVKLNDKGKPKSFYTSEFDLFRTGFMPLAILPVSDTTELRNKIIQTIEGTPLSDAMLTENTYDIRGKSVEGYETLWISKLSLYTFLESLYPGFYQTYGYQGLNLKSALTALLDFMGMLNRTYYETEFNSQLPVLPPKQPVTFQMVTDGLGINRMYANA